MSQANYSDFIGEDYILLLVVDAAAVVQAADTALQQKAAAPCKVPIVGNSSITATTSTGLATPLPLGAGQELIMEQLHYAFAIGVPHSNIIVVVNKMDDASIRYSKKRYVKVVRKVGIMLQRVGYRPWKIRCVPVSALTGENVRTAPAAKSSFAEWYKGPKLVDAIDACCTIRKESQELKVVITSVAKHRKVGVIAVGTVETGVLRADSQVIISPSGAQARILKLEVKGASVDRASVGSKVVFTCAGVTRRQVKKGDVCKDAAVANPRKVHSILVQLSVVHLTGLEKRYVTGRAFVNVKSDFGAVQCKMSLLAVINPMTAERRASDYLNKRDSALTWLSPIETLTVPDTVYDTHVLGKAKIYIKETLVACGVIRDVVWVQVASGESPWASGWSAQSRASREQCDITVITRA